ncbi:hypothetical protein EYS14_02955 [Alteromonadaceae bacterium M269]|nr:hypothetical protein EYS14_02955 [Alteromonadaceae bacterium M269]
MKHLIDIQVALATTDDMQFWEDNAELATDKLNTILHVLYDRADEDVPVQKLENMIQHVWEHWNEDAYLLDIDEVDLCDWVDHLLATWDDVGNDV